jgi:hypothetical protein
MPALSRRALLSAPAALGLSTLVSGAIPGGFATVLAQESAALPDLSDWGSVRAQFALDPSYLHFASFFIASHPAPVRNAIEGWR